MSVNDQADGFFEDDRQWGKCSHLECIGFEECLRPLAPNEHSGKGRPVNIPENDVWNLTHGRIPFRIAKGFRLLHASER